MQHSFFFCERNFRLSLLLTDVMVKSRFICVIDRPTLYLMMWHAGGRPLGQFRPWLQTAGSQHVAQVCTIRVLDHWRLRPVRWTGVMDVQRHRLETCVQRHEVSQKKITTRTFISYNAVLRDFKSSLWRSNYTLVASSNCMRSIYVSFGSELLFNKSLQVQTGALRAIFIIKQ